MLTPGWLGLSMALALALGGPQVRRVAQQVQAASRSLFGTAGKHQLRWAPILGVVTAAPFFIAALLPPTDWDSLMYHLRVPLQYLEATAIFLPPDNLHAGYLGPLQFLYLPMLAVGATAAPATLNMGFSLLLAFAVFDLGRSFVGERPGLLAFVLLFGSSSLLLVASTARIDTSLALFLTLSLVILETRIRTRGASPSAFALGLILGGALAVKASAALFLPCLLATYALAERRLPKQWARVGHEAILLGAGAGLVLAPWLVKNTLLMGHPLGLLQMKSHLDPWLASMFGSTDFPAGMPALASRALVAALQPFALIDFFIHPGRLTIEAEGSLYFPPLVFVALPLLAFIPRSGTVLRVLIASLGFAVAVVLYRPATNLRYLIPALPGLTLAAAYLLEQLSLRMTRAAQGQRVLLSVVVVATLIPTWAAGIAKVRASSGGWEYLHGRVSLEEYVGDPRNPLGGFGPILMEANSALPPESTILLLFEARGAYFRPTALQDNRLLSWPALVARLGRDPCLNDTGISHVIVNDGAVNLYLRRGVDPASLGLPELAEFKARCLLPLAANESHTLYTLRSQLREP